MTEFLLFRHGETDWNLNRKFQGHTDIRLNDTGHSQAKALSEKIKFWKPDIILTSDLTRAVQTMEYSNLIWKVPVIQSADLREMNLGKAEGLVVDEVMQLVGPDWMKWNSSGTEDENFSFPGGESKIASKRRVLNFLEKFAKENPRYKRIAVSTHGGILRRVTEGLPGVPSDGVPLPNCVTYRLNFDGYAWNFVKVRERSSAVVVHEKKILAFHAIDPHSLRPYRFLPGGMIENNETAFECVARESLEETGYEVSPHQTLITREYDFTWNNQDVWCRTHFVKADLKSDFNSPKKVVDADYHKGVVWLPDDELYSHFHYDESIFEVVSMLTR